ncbi:hypothetical protein BofuT4_P044870.1 [Botrytis cinerea T4]|uniref:Uncharacterized protein n=1 Tax=Botryotinia fuckeliana (strain T4) TaxID=999810 RepID=G2XYD2_BOTF4|nr:hypothetical protein BofuT4_P044870.1 [Botrytis cinerea T4]
MGIELPAYILGALTAGGGTMGYVRTGSIPSVAAGLTVGSLYLLGGYRIQSRLSYGVEYVSSTHRVCPTICLYSKAYIVLYRLALLASVVLAGSSIPRAIRSQKPLPAGLSLLALYGLFTFGNAFRARK